MKRILTSLSLAAAALFLFTGCGYDFLFGGELSVTLTASEELDLWYHQPALHLKSGSHQIDEKMAASASGGSAGVTVSHLKEADWTLWITLDGYPGWESARVTLKVEGGESLTLAEALVSLSAGDPDLRWILHGDAAPEPAVALDTALSQVYLAEGTDYEGGGWWDGRSAFSLYGDFLLLSRVEAAFPDGSKIDSGFLGSRSFSTINIEEGAIFIENSSVFGPGNYRVILRDIQGGQLTWGRSFEQSPQEAFGLTPVNPSASNVWTVGDPIKFQISGWEKAGGYLIILFDLSLSSVEAISWFPGPFTLADHEYPVTLATGNEYLLFIAVTDAALNNPAGFTADLNAELSASENPRDVLSGIPHRIPNYLAPGDGYSLFGYTVHRIYVP